MPHPYPPNNKNTQRHSGYNVERSNSGEWSWERKTYARGGKSEKGVRNLIPIIYPLARLVRGAE